MAGSELSISGIQAYAGFRSPIPYSSGQNSKDHKEGEHVIWDWTT